MNMITLTPDTIAEEHICCAISDKKCVAGYLKKKEWLRNQIEQGYVFKKFDVRHKVFIEYCPAEIAWLPITAPNYIVINCFWVAGKYAGNGYGTQLLQSCFHDAKASDGIVVLTGNRKLPYLADKRFFLRNGFEICDAAPPYFELLVYKNNEKAIAPTFNKQLKKSPPTDSCGLTVYYSHQCPYTDYYSTVVLKQLAEQANIPLTIHKISSRAAALSCPSPFPTYSVFYNGKFLTHEMMTETKFHKWRATL